MKTLKIFMILLVFTTGIAKAQFTKAELQVSGLTCALCSKATEKSLKTLPFISEIKTDLMRNIFIITFKNGEQVNFDKISECVPIQRPNCESLKGSRQKVGFCSLRSSRKH